MSEESFEAIEQQLSMSFRHNAPPELRPAVLVDVERELRASRWDRRLGQTAFGLLAVGVGLNAGIILQESIGDGARDRPLAHVASRQSLVDTAVLVAEATDSATGSRFARQLAAIIGRELTADEAAAIDAAVRPAGRETTNGNKG
jgi:hypothetical protein